MRRVLFFLALLASPAAGEIETRVGAAEFRAYAEGHTLYFEQDGREVGSETFHPGGETTWRYTDGTCVDGVWKSQGDELCFYYGDPDGVQCWAVLRDQRGLKVRRLGELDPPDLTYRITGRDRRPLLCGAPSVKTRFRSVEGERTGERVEERSRP